MIELLTIFIFMVLAVLLGLCIINLLTIRNIEISGALRSGPPVSVLVPARNEEVNIKNCVDSLLAQNYQNLEVIVIDDNSEDSTPSILGAYCDDRLTTLSGKPLPEGWVGKNYACDQLQAKASGEYLLFVDADTVLHPDCIGSAVKFAKEQSTDLLSVMPHEICLTFWEKAVIPMLYFAVTVFLPMPMIERSRNSKYAMGNGQFMFFRRDFYDSIGGHESLKNRIVEDVWLARRVKEFGGRALFADAKDIVSCRMYRGLDEIWRGFSKNVFAGISFSITGLSLILIAYFVLLVIPAAALAVNLLSGTQSSYFLAASAAIPVVMRILQAVRFRQSILFSFLNPLSAMFIIAVGINSYFHIRHGKGAGWKGRQYAESVISSD